MWLSITVSLLNMIDVFFFVARLFNCFQLCKLSGFIILVNLTFEDLEPPIDMNLPSTALQVTLHPVPYAL